MLYILSDMAKIKTAKQMERHLKGVANHRRIETLLLIAARGGITLEEIISTLKVNDRTIGEHTRRLHIAGLINKRYQGKFVQHTLSPYGKIFARFLQALQQL